MKKLVGKYPMGPVAVSLYVNNGTGGGFDLRPNDGMAEIVAGLGQAEFWHALATLQHEALEASFLLSGLRYNASPDYSYDNGNYMFAMTHTQFSEASARAAMFISACHDDFRRAYKKHAK